MSSRRDRRALDLVAFFVLTFLLYYVRLLFSPELVNGVKFNASAAWYLVYVTFPLLIVLALYDSPPAGGERQEARGSARGSHRRRGPTWPRWTLTAFVTLGVALFLIAEDVHTLDRDFSFAPRYRTSTRMSAPDRASGLRSQLHCCRSKYPERLRPDGRLVGVLEENFLSVVDPGRPIDPGAGHFSVITDHGLVRPVSAKVTAVIPTQELVDTSSGAATRASQSGMCVALNAGHGWLRLAVPHQQSTNGRLFVALAYSAVGTAAIQMTTVSLNGAYHENAWPITITAGRRVAVYPLDGRTFDNVQFSSLSGHARVCVSGAAVLQPVWTTTGATCSVVDDYGGLGPATSCGTVVDSTKQLSALISAPS